MSDCSMNFCVTRRFINFIVIACIIQYFIVNVLAQTCTDSRSRPGNCVTLTKCPNLIEEFYDEAKNTPNGIDFQTYVSDLICGFDGTNFMICCRNRRLNIMQNTPPPKRFQPTFATPTTAAQPPAYPAYQLPSDSLFQFATLGTFSGNSVSVNTSPLPPSPINTQQIIPTSAVYRPSPIPTNPTRGSPVIETSTFQQQQQQISSCGISRGTTNRVVGGTEAKKGSYPWIAALGYYEEFDRNALKFLCAGSLITNKYVVTSGHCIGPTLTLVRLGAHDLSNPAETTAMDFRIKRTVVHESFDLKSITNDIALIELNSAAPSTNTIDIICLPETANFLTQNFVGMNPFIAGWGAVKHQGPTSTVLREVQVPVISRAACEQSYKSVFKFVEFNEQLICAGNGNVDACQGDSGGPLMMPQLDGSTYRYYLLGIVSYGYECARPGFPGVYTRVASYIPWLKRNIQ